MAWRVPLVGMAVKVVDTTAATLAVMAAVTD
jgi:hypothetical protein